MEGVSQEHVHEVRLWLGLFRNQPPKGLHGHKRGHLIARHTRIDAERKAMNDSLATADQAEAAQFIDRKMAPVKARSEWRSINDALATTYTRDREIQIMHLLRPQRLDDRLWRWVYALMVTGGPILLPSLIAFIARLTGPKDIADAEAVYRYREWDKRTYVKAGTPPEA